MNLGCNNSHIICRNMTFFPSKGFQKAKLASGNCCVMCNLALFRSFFSQEEQREEEEEEEGCLCDRRVGLCLRLQQGWILCVAGAKAKTMLFF